MHSLLPLQFVAVALLILANAFFVAAEFALVSIRETRIEQLLAAGVPGARAVRRLQQDLDDFLPAVQLGVTLCSLALGWLGEPLAASSSTRQSARRFQMSATAFLLMCGLNHDHDDGS